MTTPKPPSGYVLDPRYPEPVIILEGPQEFPVMVLGVPEIDVLGGTVDPVLGRRLVKVPEPPPGYRHRDGGMLVDRYATETGEGDRFEASEVPGWDWFCEREPEAKRERREVWLLIERTSGDIADATPKATEADARVAAEWFNEVMGTPCDVRRFVEDSDG